jgi:hypothetical protein
VRQHHGLELRAGQALEQLRGPLVGQVAARTADAPAQGRGVGALGQQAGVVVELEQQQVRSAQRLDQAGASPRYIEVEATSAKRTIWRT